MAKRETRRQFGERRDIALLSGNRVVATASPRMTTADALHGKPSAFENAIFFYCLDGIL